MKKTLFLIFSSAIVILSVISICTAPIINGLIPKSSRWKNANCKLEEDEYKMIKDEPEYEGKDDDLKKEKKEMNECKRKKAMYGLEFSSLIIDIFLGFICAIFGLLHFFDVGKYFQKISALIGFATGIIGLVLTTVYVGYSGYIFTNDKYIDSDDDSLFKRDSKGAYAEWDDNEKKYRCLYYSEKNSDAIYARFSDLGKKQYNYEKKKTQADLDSEFIGCRFDDSQHLTNENGIDFYPDVSKCGSHEFYSTGGYKLLYSGNKKCENLYLDEETGVENKYIYDNWVTSIIFCCFIMACDIGLAIFGFLLFKDGSSGI